MSPIPLTPISEESLPNFVGVKIQKENTPVSKSNFLRPDEMIPTAVNSEKKSEDKGCLFFYDAPEARGTFEEDSFFSDAQKNYDRAVKDILTRSPPVADRLAGSSDLSTYREIQRQNGAKQDTQASALTELTDKYQIVLDVENYSPADITVKAVGDQELMIEGRRTETKDGAKVNQSFSRRFCLPGRVYLNAVTSALSSDGVLTVTAPKVYQEASVNCTQSNGINGPPRPTSPQFKCNSSNINATDNCLNGINESSSHTSKNSSIKSNLFDEKNDIYKEELGNLMNDLDLEARMKYQNGFKERLNEIPQSVNSGAPDLVEEEKHYQITLDTKGYNPNEISVKAVGNNGLLIEGKHITKSDGGSESNKSFSRRFSLPGLVNLEAVTSSLSLEGMLTVRAPKVIQEKLNKISNQHREQVSDNHSNNEYYMQPFDDFFSKDFDTFNEVNLQNSFMNEARNNYNKSLKNMMNRSWLMDPAEPEIFSVGTPRMSMKNGSSIHSSDIVESEQDYKMTLDVSKYKPEEISVKAVGEQELLIEGKHKSGTKTEANSPAVSHSFSRRLHLPGPVNLEAITSSLAKNGSITITAPKLSVI